MTTQDIMMTRMSSGSHIHHFTSSCSSAESSTRSSCWKTLCLSRNGLLFLPAFFMPELRAEQHPLQIALLTKTKIYK